VAAELCQLAQNNVASNVGSLVQRVSGTSVQEIDKLTAELQNDAARVQPEIVKYAILTQRARQSMRTISESVSFWKHDRDASRLAPKHGWTCGGQIDRKAAS
jgi:hypothetical protein